MNEQKPPRPLSLSIRIPVMVRCSFPECLSTTDVDALPLQIVDVSAPPIVDRAELAASLPAGWKVGSMRPMGMGLFLKDGPPPDARPMPVCFCPAHNPEQRS